MNSLKEVFSAVTARDHEKVAQVRVAQGLPAQPDLSHTDPDLIKQAQDYDSIGRTLAHHVFADMVKQAVDEAMPDASEGDKKSAFEEAMAEAMSGKKAKKEGEDESEYEERKPSSGDEEKKDGEEKTSAAKLKAKKKKILAKMAQDPQYVARLVAKYQG
jgi:hypothetical protein